MDRITNTPAQHWPIVFKLDILVHLRPRSQGIVKLHFRWNPKWRTAFKLDIL